MNSIISTDARPQCTMFAISEKVNEHIYLPPYIAYTSVLQLLTHIGLKYLPIFKHVKKYQRQHGDAVDFL